MWIADAVIISFAAALLVRDAFRSALILMVALFVSNLLVGYRIRRKQQPSRPTTKHDKWMFRLGIAFVIAACVALLKGVLKGFSWDTIVGFTATGLIGAMYLHLSRRARQQINH
jgi:divalent metal cation (Fe/Co/Zn/Cd) transporter